MASPLTNRTGVDLGAVPGAKSSRAVLVALVLVAALGLSACVSGDVPAAPADDPVLVEGQALFASNCVSCHGSAGGGGIGSKLNEGRLLERYPDPSEQLLIVVEGRRAMPGFSDKLSAGEIEAVVRYTREVIAEQ